MRFILILGAMVISVALVSTIMPGSASSEEKSENPLVNVETNMGSFTIELYEEEAPITVKNFLNYVDKKFYDGTIFHRIIPTFVIQGGGFTEDMTKKATAAPITNEADNGLKNLKTTLSMARTMDINSATCQFFINLKDNSALDHKGTGAREYGYAVFGKVIEGWDVVEKIKGVKTTTKGSYKDVPVKPVVIKSMSRKEVEKTEEEEE